MSLEQTLDEVLRREWIDQDSISALRQFPPDVLLLALRQRFAETDSLLVQGNILDVCADVLGETAGPWIREVADGPISNMITRPFCRALAHCVGDDGFAIATAKLANESAHQLPLTAHALLEFDEKLQILDWIEERLHAPNQAARADWGQLAAIAGIKWQRVAVWLDRGKPLSLVALDALNFCWDYGAGIGGWLNTYKPKLLAPADDETMRARLLKYAEDNPTPRVTRRVTEIMEHLHDTFTA